MNKFIETKNLFLIAVLISVFSYLESKTIFTCGASKGFTYMFSIDKFNNDSIKDGSFVLRKLDEKYEFGYIDSTKTFISASEDGGIIEVMEINNSIIIQIAYPAGALETYQVYIPTKTMVWTKNRFIGGGFDNVKIMSSKCIFSEEVIEVPPNLNLGKR